MSILSTIKSLFVKAELSVEHVIGDIVLKIDHLGVIEQAKREEAHLHEEAANKYVDLAEDAHAQADRAAAVATKFKNLISEEV